MKYKLKRNKEDRAMIEATWKWKGKTLLAFVMHEDCINSDDAIMNVMDQEGEVSVTLSLLEEKK